MVVILCLLWYFLVHSANYPTAAQNPAPSPKECPSFWEGVSIGAGAMLGLVLIVTMLVVCCRQLRSRCGGGPNGSDYDGRSLQNQGTELNDTALRSHQSGRPANYESGGPNGSDYDGRSLQNQGTELNDTALRSHQSGRPANHESWDPRLSYDGRALQNQGTALGYMDMNSLQNGRAAPSSNYENTGTIKKQPSVIYVNVA